MIYEVIIPDWTEGCPLRVQNVEADTPIGACEKVRHLAPTCPLDIMTVRECECNKCSDARHEAFRAELLKRFD